jgi:transposase-like protein
MSYQPNDGTSIDRPYCEHCGSIYDVREVNLVEHKRHLCKDCRRKILEWI